SIFMRAPRPYPPMRRFSSTLTRSAASGSPAGIPSRTATSPRPCDSPAVVNRNVTLPRFLQNLHRLPPTSTVLHHPPIIAREPGFGPGSRDRLSNGAYVLTAAARGEGGPPDSGSSDSGAGPSPGRSP